jgi:hypothetical protein
MSTASPNSLIEGAHRPRGSDRLQRGLGEDLTNGRWSLLLMWP